MNNFIKYPNLPEGFVKDAIIGNHPKIIEKLQKLGISFLVLNDNLSIDFSVKDHADMAACYMGNGEIYLDKRQITASESLIKMGLDVKYTEKNPIGKYPDDVIFNCCIFGNNLIYYPKGTAEEIIKSSYALNHFSVKQGYCRCSVCPINKNAVITDDIGIYKTLRNSVDVLLIKKGDIFLPGKEYGFIGGSTFMADKNTLVFFGNVHTHTDGENIIAFLNKHGVKHINLFDEKLIDIGGIIPLTTI